MLDQLVALIREWIELFYIFEVIHPYERGIRLRKGRFLAVLEPGWHWYWPLKYEQIISHPVVPDPQELREQSLTTADGQSVTIKGVVTYEVFDVQRLMLEVHDAPSALIDSSMGTIASHVMTATWDQIRTPEFIRKVEIEIRRRAKKYGVDVLELQWQDLTKGRSLRIWNSSTRNPEK